MQAFNFTKHFNIANWRFAVCSIFLTTVDALYEKVQKRTFIFTLIMVLAHIPFVIEIIVLYSKLGPRTDLDNEPKYSKLEQEESKLDNVDD